MRKIDTIILHCSATKEGQHVTVQDIDRWHRNRGFDCIGYHYVIYLNGDVVVGRPLAKVGAHCTGKNTGSIGICYVGGLDANGKPKDTRTAAQKAAMRSLINDLQSTFGCKVYGHYEFAAKACPCFDVKKEFRNG